MINVINAAHNLDNTVKMVGHIVIAVITTILFLLTFSIAVSSRYYVKNDNVVLAFGVMKSKTSIKDGVAFVFMPAKRKLVLFFTENRFLTIVINPELFDDFVKEIRAVNPEIVYNVDNTGMEDEPV